MVKHWETVLAKFVCDSCFVGETCFCTVMT